MARVRLRESFTALRHRQYRRVWMGTFVSQTGNWMQITGRAALIYDATGSTAALGTIYFLSYVPQLFLSQFAGVIADRYDRRRVLMRGQALATVGAAAMGVVAVTGTASVLTVGLISVLIGTVQAVTMPAQQALVPALVPRAELTSAITLNSATQGSTRVFGPLLAGVVNETLGIAWLFWVNTASFVVILAVWSTIRVARQPAMAETQVLEAILAGFRTVRRTPALMVAIATTFVIGGIANVYQSMGLAFTTDVVAGGDHADGTSYYTYLQAALGAGALIGILGLADLAKRRPGVSVLGGATGVAVGLVVLGRLSALGPVLAVGFVIGLCHFAVNTLVLNTIQQRTPEELRGRVLSLHTVCFVGTFPVTSMVAGSLAEAFSIPAVLTGTGVLCLAYCVPLVRWSRRLADPVQEARVDEVEEAVEEEVAVTQESMG